MPNDRILKWEIRKIKWLVQGQVSSDLFKDRVSFKMQRCWPQRALQFTWSTLRGSWTFTCLEIQWSRKYQYVTSGNKIWTIIICKHIINWSYFVSSSMTGTSRQGIMNFEDNTVQIFLPAQPLPHTYLLHKLGQATSLVWTSVSESNSNKMKLIMESTS